MFIVCFGGKLEGSEGGGGGRGKRVCEGEKGVRERYRALKTAHS